MLQKLLRIAVVGAECSGKTAFARALAAELKAGYCSEFAREWVRKNGRQVEWPDVLAIYRGQERAIEQAALFAVQSKKAAVVFDTDLLQTEIYSQHYFSRIPAVNQIPLADIYFLMGYDIPWKKELYQRGEEASRQSVHEAIVKKLHALEAKYLLCTGNLEDRLKQALAYLKHLGLRK